MTGDEAYWCGIDWQRRCQCSLILASTRWNSWWIELWQRARRWLGRRESWINNYFNSKIQIQLIFIQIWKKTRWIVLWNCCALPWAAHTELCCVCAALGKAQHFHTPSPSNVFSCLYKKTISHCWNNMLIELTTLGRCELDDNRNQEEKSHVKLKECSKGSYLPHWFTYSALRRYL